ncbi:MAG: DUF5828 family protein [Candidatus Nanohaloarchaea archaeon]
MNEEGLEETNSGVKKKGNIEEVAEFAREVEEGLEKEVSEESIEEFYDWRPREEDGKEEIERKTVEAASIKKKSVEEESKGVKDFSEAGKDTVKAGKKIIKRQRPDSELKNASRKVKRPIESGSRKMARGFEHQVYSKMMKLNPFFFDAQEFSADLRANKDGTYSMEVNVPDSEKRGYLKEKFNGSKE